MTCTVLFLLTLQITNMYTILIKDLHVRAKHGLLPEEKVHAQEFLITTEVTCVFPLHHAETDTFDYAFCYGVMREEILTICTMQSFNTIESLALTVNRKMLADRKDATKVVTRIEKTELLKDCRVGIRLTTKR